MAKRTAPRVATHATSTLITATNLLYCAASYTAQRRIKHGFGWDSLPNLTKTRLASHGRREKQKTYQHKFTAVHIFNICTSELMHKQHTRNHKIIGLHKWSQGYVVQFHTRKTPPALCWCSVVLPPSLRHERRQKHFTHCRWGDLGVVTVTTF